MIKAKQVNVFWFRRDLRIHDNRGFFEALSHDLPVLPIFILDTNILDKLPKKDHRVDFILDALSDLHEKFKQHGSGLHVYYGDPLDVYKKILKEHNVHIVFTNHDYEPYAIKRDDAVMRLLREHKADFQTFKDNVIFEKSEVAKDDGKFYSVYTPYMRKWKETLSKLIKKEGKLPQFSSEKKLDQLIKSKGHILSHKDIGFLPSDIPAPGKTIKKEILTKYGERRDFPALDATSHLGVHLRFGTVSVRDLVKKAIELKATVWLSELIWREFFMQILWHNPFVVDGPFKEKYSKIEWRNNKEEFKAWCEGRTGYPIVDAGMRELNTTGHMHNRVRMVVGSFLVKHLLINWQWGEKYFAEKLFDFDLSANNGNWQWVAGCGCDASPYFRVFNPYTQTEKFDKKEEYIKKWIPELGTDKYPDPIVEHAFARDRVLKAYSVVK